MATATQELATMARSVGLFLTTYSPGDGVTRYRFARENVDYFAVSNATYTGLGSKAASTWLRGYCSAYFFLNGGK